MRERVSLQSLGKHGEAYTFLRRAHDLSPSDDQATLRLVEVIAAVDGLEAAAAEYLETARLLARDASILTAPVRRVEDWAQEVGLKLLPAGEVEEIPFVPPRLWGEPPVNEATIALSNKPYVADIANARIFSHSSLILTSDGVVLSDSGADPRFGHAVSFVYESIVLAQRSGSVLITLDNMETREVEAGIFLAGLASDYYGHWVPEFLPKLQFLQHHPDFNDLPIIVDANMPQSHYDHLRRLVDNDLILLDARQSLICGRLLIAPSPTFFPVELFPNEIPVEEMPGLSPRAMRYFRGAERASPARRPAKRIFLARKSMQWRRLLNEEEIERTLAGLGFETVLMESLSAAEQIELFAQAEWIVAPNGSALLNLVFANTMVKLLVLIQPNLFNWGTFQGPMGELGYDTWCLQGDYAISESQKHSDYRISVDRLRAALAGMGLSEITQSTAPANGN
jgi:capsular polysaccharide biosynthesis protein